MPCNSPKFASHGVCATVIPISDHITTSNNNAMVPKSLRVRILMAEICGSLPVHAPCAREGAEYKVRSNSLKRSVDDRYFRQSSLTQSPRPRVAGRDCRPDRDHGAG